MHGLQTGSKKTKDIKIFLCVFSVLFILIAGVMYYVKNIMPKYMIQQGRKYYEIEQYDKALIMFNMASDAMEYNCEPLYYKTLAISKMPQKYENQKLLFEYSMMNDCDKVSTTANKVLKSIKEHYNRVLGENYLDNVLYKDKLVRWNNEEALTFYIDMNGNTPKEYIEAVRKAFANWQMALNSEIMFREISNPNNANICINFVDKIADNMGEKNQIGLTSPVFDGNNLNQMQIKLKNRNEKDKNYSKEAIISVTQHEIGHALGMWGHSFNENDVMYFKGDTISESVKKISDRDITTLTMIYKMMPDVIDKPVSTENMENMYYHKILTLSVGDNFTQGIKRKIAMYSDKDAYISKWVDLALEFSKKEQYERSNYILNEIYKYIKNDKLMKYTVVFNIANNYYQLKDYESAQDYAQAALKVAQTKEAKVLEAFLYYNRNNKKMAKLKFSLLINKYPDDVEIAIKLAEIYHSERDYSKEKATLETLVKKNPKALKDKRVLKYKINRGA